MDVLGELVPQLAQLPGVITVALGGSRAKGTHRPDSDWDLGVYYRGKFDATVLTRLGYPGSAAQPGEWGRIVNGGAWLSVHGQPVDVLLRDLDVIESWWADARDGRFEIDNVEGHLAGLPTYVPLGEMAIGRALHGSLPSVEYPPRLREVGSARWRWNGAFSLMFAEQYASRGDRTLAAGMLARATAQTAHGVLAERGEWALGEKGLVAAAGLDDAAAIIGQVHADPVAAAGALRELLRPPRLDELAAHTG
ncbi:nucleotidyltransferase domain-containing protein [Pseudonocardia acaciae]|uniref:nucleotidyltransferase domain-containing protein n=1 Tax=Pseudonocardia acaciae TaxID=551276 RepID=UPI0004921DEB|nr:nucleotidyltransferase domain-containing protein [Pseudonocardia acaciae]